MKTQSWPERFLKRELNRNPYTVPCLLFRERVLVTERGPMSYENDRELLALLDGGINGRIGGFFWYGHVLKVPVENGGEVQSAWAALIVPSPHFVDAPTVDLVFGRFQYAMQVRANYIPPQAQHQDDVFAYRATFDDACLALAEMIRWFNPKLRIEQVIYDPTDPDACPTYSDPGMLDMRCMGIYGLNCSKDRNGGWPDMPPYEYPVEKDQAG